MGQLKNNKRLIILVGVTLLASGILGHDLLTSGKARKRPAASSSRRVTSAKPTPAPPVPVPVPAPAATPGRRLAAPPAPDQPWEEDPFAIKGKWVSNPTFTDVKVSGIVWGPDGYKALVNDFVVRPGDVVQGMHILRITEDGVEVEKDGRTGFVHLIKPAITP